MQEIFEDENGDYTTTLDWTQNAHFKAERIASLDVFAENSRQVRAAMQHGIGGRKVNWLNGARDCSFYLIGEEKYVGDYESKREYKFRVFLYKSTN